MLDQIQAPVAYDMEQFNKLLMDGYKSDNAYIATITDYVLERRGKQMRPLLVILTAALSGKVTEKTYAGALLVEMTHTASLIHDDVIDEAYMRRGQLSVNAIWRSKTAVLVGDYILSRALSIASHQNAFDMLALLISSFESLSEGELIQMEHTSKLDMTEELYFEIIRKKTAALLGSCGAIGASSVGASEETAEKMRLFGEYIGMAFQVKDDLLDYQLAGETGKPACNDLKEQKITLPLLYLLSSTTAEEKKELIAKISTIRDKEEDIFYIQQRVLACGASQYAESIMTEYKNKALAILEEFPESDVRHSLELYCRYILERNK